MDARANDAFHEAYGRAHEAARRGTPILVVIADDLALVRGDERTTKTFASARFHTIKTIAHVAVATYILLREESERARTAALAALHRMTEPLESSPLLALTTAVLDRARQGRLGVADREDFARHAGPELLRTTEEATRIQLDDLHRVTEELLSPLGDAERARLFVVVTGDHQARVRSLAMQYFAKRLGERDGEERRVLYGEGIDDVDEAVALVGKTLLDRVLAAAFFDDPHRLQRDILGDAAKRQLDRLELAGWPVAGPENAAY